MAQSRIRGPRGSRCPCTVEASVSGFPMLESPTVDRFYTAVVSIWAISLSHSLIRSLLMSQGDSESVPYIDRCPSGPGNELSKSRGLNQSCGDARDPNLTSSSSFAQIRQYRIPECSEFMKFSVRIPILNLQKYSAQVRFTS